MRALRKRQSAEAGQELQLPFSYGALLQIFKCASAYNLNTFDKTNIMSYEPVDDNNKKNGHNGSNNSSNTNESQPES